jgi:DNA mismatch repair protein MutS
MTSLPGQATGSSILFDRPREGVTHGAPPDVSAGDVDEPACFGDLNLDQVVAAVTAGRDGYDLAPYFYVPAGDVAAVRYRHEVLRDLENDAVFAAVERFAEGMRGMREALAQAEELRYVLQSRRWFVDAADRYRAAVVALAGDLDRLEITSRGLRAFRDHLAGYVRSPGFEELAADIGSLLAELGRVAYRVHIRGSRVRVSPYEGEADYSAEVERTFAKFRQGAVKDHRVRLASYADMNHVEAQVLELVARLFPGTFAALEDFCARHRDFLDDTVRVFDRQVQFYVAYLEFMRPLAAAGLPFCHPRVAARPERIHADEAYDLALAAKFARTGRQRAAGVVTNGFQLADPERIVVVTGPNQGGKTTFARMFGQVHYLAGLGLPVPARSALLPLCDRVYTHFERQESLETLRGKLDDELVRVRDVLAGATPDSVVVLNESFNSTTADDSLFLGAEVLRRLTRRGCLALYVTFIDELASLNEAVVSMVATIDPTDPARRTYEIVRRPADGLAYAAALADKYGLSAESLRRRVAR